MSVAYSDSLITLQKIKFRIMQKFLVLILIYITSCTATRKVTKSSFSSMRDSASVEVRDTFWKNEQAEEIAETLVKDSSCYVSSSNNLSEMKIWVDESIEEISSPDGTKKTLTNRTIKGNANVVRNELMNILTGKDSIERCSSINSETMGERKEIKESYNSSNEQKKKDAEKKYFSNKIIFLIIVCFSVLYFVFLFYLLRKK